MDSQNTPIQQQPADATQFAEDRAEARSYLGDRLSA